MTFDKLDRECTVESLFDGCLTCRQHSRGYRFTQDPVLLAHFFTPKPHEKIIDLGTGCGIMPLILAYRWPGLSVTGLEVQPALADLARQNVVANGFGERLQMVEGDLRNIGDCFEAASFTRVICNPPYQPLGAARPNPDPEQAGARHEVLVTLDEVLTAIVWLLGDGGKADLIYPVGRAGALLEEMRRKGLSPQTLREVHNYPGGVCRLLLVEAVKGKEAELKERPPLYIQEGPAGGYTPEMAMFYASEQSRINSE